MSRHESIELPLMSVSSVLLVYSSTGLGFWNLMSKRRAKFDSSEIKRVIFHQRHDGQKVFVEGEKNGKSFHFLIDSNSEIETRLKPWRIEVPSPVPFKFGVLFLAAFKRYLKYSASIHLVVGLFLLALAFRPLAHSIFNSGTFMSPNCDTDCASILANTATAGLFLLSNLFLGLLMPIVSLLVAKRFAKGWDTYRAVQVEAIMLVTVGLLATFLFVSAVAPKASKVSEKYSQWSRGEVVTFAKSVSDGGTSDLSSKAR